MFSKKKREYRNQWNVSDWLKYISTIKLKQWIDVIHLKLSTLFAAQAVELWSRSEVETSLLPGSHNWHFKYLVQVTCVTVTLCICIFFFCYFGVLYINSFIYNLVLFELCRARSLDVYVGFLIGDHFISEIRCIQIKNKCIRNDTPTIVFEGPWKWSS